MENYYFMFGQEYVGPNFKVKNNNEFHFKCNSLMSQVVKSDESIHAPCKITSDYNKLFTMGGLISGELQCASLESGDVQNGVNKTWVWTAEKIDEMKGTGVDSCGTYGNPACAETCKRHIATIKNKVGIVWGSQSPWAESGLIFYGAKHITTIEYMKIESKHPKLSTIHPVEAAKKFLAKKFELVDFIFTYSSLEHDGLGRYGDPLNPYADLESIARAHCMLKPNGILFLGFPVGPDHLAGSYHRIYGKYRMSLILPMWEPIDLINNYLNLSDTKSFEGNWENQPIWVLRKKSAGHYGSGDRV
jgi:hypothetical protein